MRNRIVLWGQEKEGNRTFVTLELDKENKEVIGHAIPADKLTQDMESQLVGAWRNGEDVTFPPEAQQFKNPLTVSGAIVPDTIQIENTNILNRAQAEWNFYLMSQKLVDHFASELEELAGKIEKLGTYDKNLWEELKAFWSKVQAQVSEHNINRDQSKSLKQKVNVLFDKMKAWRKADDDRFKQISQENINMLSEKVRVIEQKVADGLSLQPLFNELKTVQAEMKNLRLSQKHRNSIWSQIDTLFKKVKELRFGDQSEENKPLERLNKRLAGLMVVIEKMNNSIAYDERELKKIQSLLDQNSGQFQNELRKAKLKLIEERLNSKTNKLEDMHKTREHVENRIEKEKAKEAKRIEKEAYDAKKRALVEKIAQEKTQTVELAPEDRTKLEQAAAAINTAKAARSKKTSKKSSKSDQLVDSAVIADAAAVSNIEV